MIVKLYCEIEGEARTIQFDGFAASIMCARFAAMTPDDTFHVDGDGSAIAPIAGAKYPFRWSVVKRVEIIN